MIIASDFVLAKQIWMPTPSQVKLQKTLPIYAVSVTGQDADPDISKVKAALLKMKFVFVETAWRIFCPVRKFLRNWDQVVLLDGILRFERILRVSKWIKLSFPSPLGYPSPVRQVEHIQGYSRRNGPSRKGLNCQLIEGERYYWPGMGESNWQVHSPKVPPALSSEICFFSTDGTGFNRLSVS